MKDSKNKVKGFQIELHTTFTLSHDHNVQNITLALAQAGYYVNITRDNNAYLVNVFKIKR